MNLMRLQPLFASVLHPRPPYNFDLSVRNPSHYPTPTSAWKPGKLWFTLRWKGEPYGVRLAGRGDVSRPVVEATIYGHQNMQETPGKDLLEELAYRFEWYTDYADFYKAAKRDDLLAPVVSRLRGMRVFCGEGLYEFLMIAILLQNATVRRTEAMSKAMLEKYGDLLEFDGQRQYCFWSPVRIIEASEAELRALKVGYRAKSFLRASEDYSRLDEAKMRTMDEESLRRTLLSIYGVGPASVDYVMSNVFHRRGALHTLPPWEAKIYSRIFFKKPKASPRRILAELKRRYGAWRGLAAHYLLMDLCWRHKKKPIEWFSALMPY